MVCWEKRRVLQEDCTWPDLPNTVTIMGKFVLCGQLPVWSDTREFDHVENNKSFEKDAVIISDACPH